MEAKSRITSDRLGYTDFVAEYTFYENNCLIDLVIYIYILGSRQGWFVLYSEAILPRDNSGRLSKKEWIYLNFFVLINVY